MGAQDIAAALQRLDAVLRRRPETGMHDDAPATARWQGGTRVVSSHANGTRMVSDMPAELGGSGDTVTPGWMFRAGLAACATTSIALAAAAEGIELAALEVHVGSRSDARGMLGIAHTDGAPVYAGPGDVQLRVRLRADGMPPGRLRALVEDALRRSPIPNAVEHATPLAVTVDIEDA